MQGDTSTRKRKGRGGLSAKVRPSHPPLVLTCSYDLPRVSAAIKRGRRVERTRSEIGAIDRQIRSRDVRGLVRQQEGDGPAHLLCLTDTIGWDVDGETVSEFVERSIQTFRETDEEGRLDEAGRDAARSMSVAVGASRMDAPVTAYPAMTILRSGDFRDADDGMLGRRIYA